MTDKCFMIQPFDGGKFDKRFDEVFKPAVVAAGLDPYRVDRDPGASIPIEEIETGIRQSAICFADVTLDNPNVWFELGYAIAVGKDICIVSSEERQTKYPFDIQHRRIINYKVESPSDYKTLGKKIEEGCKALLAKRDTRASLPAVTADKQSSQFQPFELACLVSIGMQASSATIDSWVSVYIVKSEMETLGYNNLAANVALLNLNSADFVRVKEVVEPNSGETYDVCQLTLGGWEWLNKNIASLNIKAPQKKGKRGGGFDTKRDDDEIPF
jgi:hypothetical protein